MSLSRVLVVGLGHADRGDDAVGPTVARQVAHTAGPLVDVLEHEDPTDLALLWTGRRRVVVVDAVHSGGTADPGRLWLLRAGAGLPPLGNAWSRTGTGGTHAFGLTEAIELARALDRLPAELTVVGVEATDFIHGTPLSAAVAGAVPATVAAVLDAVHGVLPPPEAGLRETAGTPR